MVEVDQGAEGLLSSFLRRRRQRQVKPLLDGRVLDFGCGGGHLAADCEPSAYLGYDRDPGVLRLARRAHPAYSFTDQLPVAESFDTIVMLAVIEHLPEPAESLASLAKLLAANGRIVGTTPHPHFDRVLAAGAKIGLFSRAANEEHEQLLSREVLVRVGEVAGLKLISYQRFLLGANQLFAWAWPVVGRRVSGQHECPP